MLNAAIYERTQILVKDEGIKRLHAANVFLAGVGGVGGHCAEALVRAGVGNLTICDGDVISATNKNRQLIAMDGNIGRSKVYELCTRLNGINSHCNITALDAFLLPEDMVDVLTTAATQQQQRPYDYVVDCIDSVECKLALLETAVKLGIRKVFSSGGAGGRLDASLVRTSDLFETEGDALSRICRQTLKKRGIGPGDITVVWSMEVPVPPLPPQRQEAGGRDRALNGTISYMPPLYGLMLSSLVIRHCVDPQGADKAAAAAKKKLLKKQQQQEQQNPKKKQTTGTAAAAAAASTSQPKAPTASAQGKRNRTEDGNSSCHHKSSASLPAATSSGSCNKEQTQSDVPREALQGSIAKAKDECDDSTSSVKRRKKDDNTDTKR